MLVSSMCYACGVFWWSEFTFRTVSPSIPRRQARRAMLFHSSGTPGNEELVRYSKNDARVERFNNVTFKFDGRVHALIGCGAMSRKLFATNGVVGRLR